MRHKKKKLDLLTLTVLHHLAVCCGCTATDSFWGRGPWVDAGHHDTSRPGPLECPYETGGRSERTPHPLWLADSWGERDKAKRLDPIRGSHFPILVFKYNPQNKISMKPDIFSYRVMHDTQSRMCVQLGVENTMAQCHESLGMDNFLTWF